MKDPKFKIFDWVKDITQPNKELTSQIIGVELVYGQFTYTISRALSSRGNRVSEDRLVLSSPPILQGETHDDLFLNAIHVLQQRNKAISYMDIEDLYTEFEYKEEIKQLNNTIGRLFRFGKISIGLV